MINYSEIAEKNQKAAFEVIKETDIENLWKSIGARINLVGSLKNGLFMKHRDIDFHIYTKELDISKSFSVMQKLALNPKIKKIEYTNLADTPEVCLEWHAWYEDKNGELWQLDLIHILEGSTYDGYFENVANTIASTVTPEQKNIILKLKYETPDDFKIMGIEYYKAVMQDNVKTYDELLEWRKKQNLNCILEW